MSTNYKQLYAKKEWARKQLYKACPTLNANSGIYFYIRKDLDGKYIYIGKAFNILERSISHMIGYSQRIDISLKKRGFVSKENPTGWELNFLNFPKDELDKWERYYIEQYQKAGYTLYNVESGGTEGKTIIGERKPPKTYRDGLEQGRKNLAKELKHIIDTHLEISLKKETKISQKALVKFWELLNYENEENNNE